MPPNTKVDDAEDPADCYNINTVGQTPTNSALGYYCAPNAPNGDGPPYAHSNGSGPGGLMAAMALSWGQEFFGFEMRYLISKACKESALFLFNDTAGGMSDWHWSGNMQSGGDGPYQIQKVNYQQAIQCFPDYFEHAEAFIDIEGNIGVAAKFTNNIVTATTMCYLVLGSRYYGYYSVARSLRIDEFQKNAQDPFAMLRVVGYGFNRGPHVGDVWNLAYGANRQAALGSKNLAKYNNIVGVDGYTPRIVDLMRRIGRDEKVYDEGIVWGDVQDLLKDLRETHYVNGFPTNTQWSAMAIELNDAFDRMKGKAPTNGLGPDEISFRYNWLTVLRVMKKYLPCSGLYHPKGTMTNKAIEFFDIYVPSGQIEETKPAVPDTNYAPEIYWITPAYEIPISVSESFPQIEVQTSSNFTVTVDVLDDKTGNGELEVRYSLSSGNPSSNYSYWLDGEKTGGTVENPVAVDWLEMSDIGASTAPAGGRKFSITFDASGIQNELRRLYIEANDNCGYRTISWIDVYFKDDGLPDLVIDADPPDGTRFVVSTSVTLTVTDENGNAVNDVTIYYTLDGTDPTTSSDVYSGPIILAGNPGDVFVVKALAVATGYTAVTGQWTYYQDAAAAWINADPPDGTVFKTTLSITLTTNADTIYYTTDGSDPVTNGMLYTGPFDISGDIVVVKGLAKGQGYTPATGQWTYYKDSDTAWINADPPDGTTFQDQLTVTLTTNADTIYYTTDGSDPAVNGTLYTGPFVVSDILVIVKGIAIGDGYIPASGTWKYYKESDTAWVDADPGNGSTYGEQLTITLTTNADTIYYTTDGSDPVTGGTLYTGPFIISGGDVTVKAVAIGENFEPGYGSWTYYQVTLPDVIATPPGQEFATSISVTLTLSSPWPGAKIYYTIDGIDPDTNSITTFIYDGTPIEITETTTLKAQAYASNALPSKILIEVYTQVFDIIKAWYRDNDGDGRIDMTELHTNKEPDELPGEVKLTNPFNNTDIKTVTGSDISWRNNDPSSQVILVTHADQFPYDHSTGFIEDTYGQIVSGEFLKEPFNIRDGVAPVVDNAVYHPGKVIDRKTLERALDTLVVVFSEKVSGIGVGVDQFFRLVTESGVPYYFDLVRHSGTDDKITFIVQSDGMQGVPYPVNGDSIWINETDNIADTLYNVQNIVNNRHVPLVVLSKPWAIEIKALTPFTPAYNNLSVPELDNISGEAIKNLIDNNGGLIITVNLLTDLSGKEDSIGCAIAVYDPVVNLVDECLGIDEESGNFRMGIRTVTLEDELSTQIVIYWNGYNGNGRRIGWGMYQAAITVYVKGMKEIHWVKIGVKK